MAELTPAQKRALLRQLQLEATRHAIDLCQHVLEQLADERLQSHLVQRFVSLLSSDAEDSRQVREALADGRTVIVESSHELSEQDRSKVVSAIGEIGESIEPEFRVNSELICGIELRAAGCKAAWSVQGSLAELAAKLVASIDEVIPDQADDASAAHRELATS